MLARAALALAVILAGGGTARAQDDAADLKKRIMEEVRKRLEAEKSRILEEVARAIDQELGTGAPAEKKRERAEEPPAEKDREPRAEKPARGADPRLRELQRKRLQLLDQLDDLERDIRAIRRETEDAEIVKEARENPPRSGQEAQGEFQNYLKAHEAKEFTKSIEGFKRLWYVLKALPNAEGIAIPSAYNVACGYALTGDKDQALDWLEIAIRAGYNDWDHLRQDTDLDSLRKERRYLRLMADR